jgi:hypothetical protein
MRKNLCIATISLSALASCFVSTPELDTNSFACKASGDCANGYTCNQTLGVCAKTCSEPNDCPTSASQCNNGVCGDACAVKEQECANAGLVCVLDNGNPACKACNLNSSDCKNPNKACVSQGAGVATCAPTCELSQGTTCPWTGAIAHCVAVKLAGGPGYREVCAPCPSTCVSDCSSATNNQADTYAQATMCSSQSCSASSPCTAGGEICVPGNCRKICTTNADCGTNAACVYVSDAINPPARVCKACSVACADPTPICMDTDANPAQPTPYANIGVACKAAAAGWQPIAAGALTVPGSSDATELAFAIGPTGLPVVAWANGTLDCVKVSDWNDTNWPNDLCARSVTGFTASNPALLVQDESGVAAIHVAWVQKNAAGANENVYWAKLASGRTWANVGTLSGGQLSNNGTGVSYDVQAPCTHPAIGNAANNLVAVWRSIENTGAPVPGGRGRFQDATNATWFELGSSGSGPTPGLVTGIGNTTIPLGTVALTASGSATYVAWDNMAGTIFARVLTAASTSAVWALDYLPSGSDDLAQGVSGMSGTSQGPAIAIDEAGAPVIAWQRKMGTGRFNIEIVHAVNSPPWNWTPYGSSRVAFSSATVDATNVSLAYLNYNASYFPIVAFLAGTNVYVLRFLNSSWSGLEAGDNTGTGLSGTDSASTPKIAAYVDWGGLHTNKICVAWIATGIGIRVLCHPLT